MEAGRGPSTLATGVKLVGRRHFETDSRWPSVERRQAISGTILDRSPEDVEALEVAACQSSSEMLWQKPPVSSEDVPGGGLKLTGGAHQQPRSRVIVTPSSLAVRVDEIHEHLALLTRP